MDTNLSHLDSRGQAHMVDVSAKSPAAFVTMV
jgi:molybdenum cofactor biosynthesis enzyme